MTTTTAEAVDYTDVEHADVDPIEATTDATEVDVVTLAATLVDIDPRALAANPTNVRTNLGDLGPLAASIAAVGVLEPLVVIPDGSGGHRIVAGHRRNAAAIEADQATVPCIVRPDLAAADATAAVVAMIVENSHRLDLSAQDEARAYEQLAMAGLSAAKIAKRVGHKPAHIKKALAVAGSELAVTAAERYTLTLDQAAVLAEFDGDADAVKALVVTAKKDPGQWDHVVSRLRQDRKAVAARAAAVKALVDAGVTVIDRPSHRDAATRLSNLADDKGKELDAENHAACPGHAAVVDDYDPKRVTYFCVDPVAHGHKSRWGGPASSTTAPAVVNGKMTEEAKAARREVIDNNKSWRAAEPVRRDYIRNLLARKTPPKDALRFVTAEIVAAPDRVGDGKDELLADLLSKPTPTQSWGRTIGAAAVANVTEARLPLLLLAQVAADREQAMDESTWRSVHPSAARWLTFLATTGYTLAPIEQKIVDDDAANPDTGDDPGAEGDDGYADGGDGDPEDA
jgi:ParB family chromosome partitioning protein